MFTRRKWLLTALSAILIGSLNANYATAAKEDGTVLRRMTLMVHDVEASIAFYRDVLGFAIWFRTTGNVGAEGLPTSDAKPGDPTDFAIMKGRDPYIGMIGLLQYGEKRPVPGPDADRRLHAGKQILMIEIDDLDGAIAKMKARGMLFIGMCSRGTSRA